MVRFIKLDQYLRMTMAPTRADTVSGWTAGRVCRAVIADSDFVQRPLHWILLR